MSLLSLSLFAVVLSTEGGIDATDTPGISPEIAPPPAVMIEGQQVVPSSGTQYSEQRHFTVSAQPGLRPMRLNTLHNWTFMLQDSTGRPVDDATIRVSGGMPQHGHGLPTAPRMSHGTKPGLYLLQGMRFNMTGLWQLRLDIQRPGVADRVIFNFIVPDATGK